MFGILCKLCIFLETKNSMIIAPNMCPFKEEIIEQLNEAKKKEREIRMSNFAAMDQAPDEKNKRTGPSLPFRQRWLAKETREDRYPDKDYKSVTTVLLKPYCYV